MWHFVRKYKDCLDIHVNKQTVLKFPDRVVSRCVVCTEYECTLYRVSCTWYIRNEYVFNHVHFLCLRVCFFFITFVFFFLGCTVTVSVTR